MPEITEYKTGDKIKCTKDFDNLGIVYNEGDECEIFDMNEDDEDICEITLPEELYVTMDKDCLKNFNKI